MLEEDMIASQSSLSWITPTYSVPVEIKKHSKGFVYQQKKYGKDELSRALILCAVHDLKNVPRNIDVIELEALCDHLEHV